MTKREIRKWRKKIHYKKTENIKRHLRNQTCDTCYYFFQGKLSNERCEHSLRKGKKIPKERTCPFWREGDIGEYQQWRWWSEAIYDDK